MKNKITMIICLCTAFSAFAVEAQQFVIEPDQSTWTFLPSGRSIGFEACLEDVSACQLNVEGSFELVIDPHLAIAEFQNVQLTFFGNDHLANTWPLLFPASDEVVTDLPQPLALKTPPHRDSRFQPTDLIFVENIPFSNFTATLRGDLLLLTGGFDGRPFDGHGEYYDVVARRTVNIPEPSTLLLGALAAAVLLQCKR